MRQEDTVKHGALKYLFVLFIQRVIGVALFIVAAGTIMDLRGIVYFSMYLIISLIACLIMYNGHQDTLNERGRKQENTKGWDKLLLPILVILAFYGIYLVAGLGIRLQWKRLPDQYFYIGTAIYIISGVFTIWPVVENRHFESTARIQDDRAQTVISTGPYRFVRHPGYLGIVIWAVATALMFGTWAVGATAAVIIIVVVIRTNLEDAMLTRELSGYLDYAKKVKYRLFPFIW